jgi:hypothetical protein
MTQQLKHPPCHFLSTHETCYLLRAREISPPECVTLQRSYWNFCHGFFIALECNSDFNDDDDGGDDEG